MARPEGFEPPTNWFEASYSIQLSYGRPAGRHDGMAATEPVVSSRVIGPGQPGTQG